MRRRAEGSRPLGMGALRVAGEGEGVVSAK